MNKLIENVLGFVLLLCALAVIAAPLILVIQHPNSGEWIAAIGNKNTPWLVTFFIVAIFNDGIRHLFFSVGRTFDRIKRVSAGATAAELDPIQGAPTINNDRNAMTTDTTKGLFDTPTLNLYYLKYVISQIFASQFELLVSLKESSKRIQDAVSFYEKFKSRIETETDYSFESWLNFLKVNSLIYQPTNEDKLELTEQGRVFVDAIEHLNPRPKFRY